MKEPSISQYLVSTCLLTIDGLNIRYSQKTKEELKEIANEEYNEIDIAVMIGYPFRDMAHYNVAGSNRSSKNNHDIVVESKEFIVELKYLRNWSCSTGTKSASKTWAEYQKDFDWLISEIKNGNKHKRAFIVGWFNCVESLAQYIQLGKNAGNMPIINEERIVYFPFLKRLRVPTRNVDLAYNYQIAYKELSANLIGDETPNLNCIFLGNEKDTFHFAIYY